MGRTSFIFGRTWGIHVQVFAAVVPLTRFSTWILDLFDFDLFDLDLFDFDLFDLDLFDLNLFDLNLFD